MQFTVLPGKNPSPEQMELFNSAFEFWYQNWVDVYKRIDPMYVLSANEFFRQDYFGVIHENDKPLAVHLYSVFDIRCCSILKHEYLKQNFTASFFEYLKKNEIFQVMSFESMMVDPSFRKRAGGIGLAPLLFSQGIQFLQSLENIQAMVAPARSDVGVAQLAQSGGCEIIENIDLHGVPVSLVCGLRENLHLNFLTTDLKDLALQLFSHTPTLTRKVPYDGFDIKRIAS